MEFLAVLGRLAFFAERAEAVGELVDMEKGGS
jgi:hypothetical protein